MIVMCSSLQIVLKFTAQLVTAAPKMQKGRKGGRKGKGRGGPGAKARPRTADAETAAAAVSKEEMLAFHAQNCATNATFHKRMLEAWQNIEKGAPQIFWDLATVGPQNITATEDNQELGGAIQSPYRQKEADVVLLDKNTKDAIYRCALPLSMIHKTYSAMPHVRVSLSQVLRHKNEHYVAGPRPLIIAQRIALVTGEDVMARDLTSLGPPEDPAALLLQVE